jgi:two-component system response regulator NreC
LASNAQPITVVLADDHAVVRSGLRMVLEREKGIDVVAEAADAASALETVASHRPAILVLDLTMPGMLGPLDAIPRVRKLSPATRVLVLTMQENPEFVRRALRKGASGYVLKEAADEELIEAVRRVADGGTYVDPRLRAVLRTASAKPGRRPGDLTEREVEVVRGIALGYASKEIARQLGISVRTVETHRAHIHRKLDVSTRAELVRYAFDQGFIEG